MSIAPGRSSGVSRRLLLTPLPRVPKSERSESSKRVTGNPLAKRQLPERLQPSVSRFLRKNWSKASAYVYDTTTLCGMSHDERALDALRLNGLTSSPRLDASSRDLEYV